MLSPITSRADIVNDIFQVTCMPELGTLEIRTFNINGKLAQNNLVKHSNTIREKFSIHPYDPELFEFGPDHAWQKSKTYHGKCILPVTDDPTIKKTSSFNYAIGGSFQNVNPNGLCGGWRTINVTLKLGDKVLMDQLSFGQSCESDSMIESLRLSATQAYDEQDNGYILLTGTKLKKSFFYIGKKPITNDDVYNKE
jgi:hypothetical protein